MRSDTRSPGLVLIAPFLSYSDAFNLSTGNQQASILTSEASINIAKGESQATLLRADARAGALERLGKAVSAYGGDNVSTLKVAEKWVEAFERVEQERTAQALHIDVETSKAAITGVGEPFSFVLYFNDSVPTL